MRQSRDCAADLALETLVCAARLRQASRARCAFVIAAIRICTQGHLAHARPWQHGVSWGASHTQAAHVGIDARQQYVLRLPDLRLANHGEWIYAASSSDLFHCFICSTPPPKYKRQRTRRSVTDPPGHVTTCMAARRPTPSIAASVNTCRADNSCEIMQQAMRYQQYYYHRLQHMC